MEITFWVNDDDCLWGGRVVYFYCLFSAVHVFSQLQQSCSDVQLLGSSNRNILVCSCPVSHQEALQGLINTTLISVF